MIQQTNTNSYYSHGKLLLSGEYTVLHGATALALPLRYGQTLSVSQSDSAGLVWRALRPGGIWFACEWDTSGRIIQTTDKKKSLRLDDILRKGLALSEKNPAFLSGKEITTTLEFNPEWGWGSSSTFISNLSRWLEIDPYKLLQQTFGGSGYDIACAGATSAIYYSKANEKTEVTTAPFCPSFGDQLWFIYLGKKQSSQKAISAFSFSNSIPDSAIRQISELTNQVCSCDSVDDFCEWITQHETIIGNLTGMIPVQSLLFPDFEGAVKSLGAWGGDFVMACSHWSEEKIRAYFKTRGLETVFNLKEIILTNR